MNHLIKYTSFLLLVLILLACKDKSSGFKHNVAGKAGELLIVMDDKIKKSEGGKELQRAMIQTYLGLPQDEPHFDLLVTPHRGFSSHMKTFRNIIVTDISPKVKADTIRYFKDMWAQPQSTVRITAKDTATLRRLVQENELRLISFFNKAARNRNISYYKTYPNAEVIEELKQLWKIKMNVPTNLQKRNSNKSITWLGEDTEWGSQGLLIYEYPYIGEGTFSKEYLLNKRDSMLHRNIPGPIEGSYMTTEHGFPIIYKQTRINDVPVVELRGLWKVQNDMMGGPFIMHAHHDTKNNRVVITEGFVYSPEKPDKREKIRQLESLLYTFQLQ